MIKYKGFAIDTSGEYPTVGTLKTPKEGKNKGVEQYTPVYYPNSIPAALKTLLRLTQTDASKASKDFKSMLKVMQTNHKDFMKMLGELDCRKLVKEGSDE